MFGKLQWLIISVEYQVGGSLHAHMFLKVEKHSPDFFEELKVNEDRKKEYQMWIDERLCCTKHENRRESNNSCNSSIEVCDSKVWMIGDKTFDRKLFTKKNVESFARSKIEYGTGFHTHHLGCIKKAKRNAKGKVYP